MAECPSGETPAQHGNDARKARRSPDATLDKGGPRPDGERTAERWWRAGLIAALVFLALAILCNAIVYRTLARVEQRLALSAKTNL